MRDTDLFQMALGLFPPWLVERCTFDRELKQLDIYIDFSRGGEFASVPNAGVQVVGHMTQ